MPALKMDTGLRGAYPHFHGGMTPEELRDFCFFPLRPLRSLRFNEICHKQGQDENA